MSANSVHTYLHEAMREDYDYAKDNGRGAEFIAMHFHKSAEWVYKCMSGERAFPLHRIGEWKDVTGGDAAARWVARQLGLAYVPMPQCTSGEVAELADVVERNAESVISALQIYADGRVDKREAREAVPAAVAKLRRCIESELCLIEKIEADAKAAKDGPGTMRAFELGIAR